MTVFYPILSHMPEENQAASLALLDFSLCASSLHLGYAKSMVQVAPVNVH